jgi:hypothetical protein
MMVLREHVGRWYAIQSCYDPSAEAWSIELSDAVPAPASWAEDPGAPAHMPGRPFVEAIVPDEDPRREPEVYFADHDGPVPLAIVQWFLGEVAEEVAEARRSEPS